MFNTAAVLQAIEFATGICAARHSAYTANIANAEVPGYQRMEVSFDTLLDAAGRPDATAVSSPQFVTTGEGVRVDQEMARLAENAVRYQILLRAFDATIATVRSAARDGRGG